MVVIVPSAVHGMEKVIQEIQDSVVNRLKERNFHLILPWLPSRCAQTSILKLI